jgi:CheY-like chemotaxis protein
VDGFALAGQIKQSADLAGAVLLMLSSAGRPEDTARCARLGIATYLTKPIKQSELLDAILAARHRAGPDERDRTAEGVTPALVRPLRVLLAEDSAINQQLAVRLLEKAGHTVTVANNGREAVEALQREAFDLVLMDVQMPEMGGFEATAALRAREQSTGQHIPIIAMTAHAMKGDRERCLAAGMDDYVSKPVRARDLFDAIARSVASGVRSAEREVPSAPPSTIDEADLLDRVGGDRALLQDMVRMFLETYPESLTELRAAVAGGDAARLHRLAHTFKGMVGHFGARAAVEAALRLEVMGREGDLEQAEQTCAALVGAVEDIRPALTRLLDDGGPA